MKIPTRHLAPILLVVTSSSLVSAQTIFDDDMESYTSATATSINDLSNNSTSNPPFWSRNSFQDGGTAVSVSAGITGASGSRAAILSADFTGATGFWGAQLRSAASSSAGTASSFADLTYSFDIQTSAVNGFYLEFTSFDSNFAPTGTFRKSFTVVSAGVLETFSGNLGESGWAANPFGFSSDPLALGAPNYSWSVEYGSEFGWPAGAGNSLQVDQAKFGVVPEPSIASLLLGSICFVFAATRRRYA